MKAAAVPCDFPQPRVYRPTLAEFEDFPSYVQKMEDDGCHLTGICKVVVPEDWVARSKGYDVDSFDFDIQRPVAQRMTPMGGNLKGVYQVSFIRVLVVWTSLIRNCLSCRQSQVPSKKAA